MKKLFLFLIFNCFDYKEKKFDFFLKNTIKYKKISFFYFFMNEPIKFSSTYKHIY